MSIKLNLNQARQLLDFFGGEDAQVTVSDTVLNMHSGPGLYAWLTEHPDDGSIKLDAETPMEDEDGVAPSQAPSINCPACNGYGRVNDGSGARSPYGPKCPTCGGSGRVADGVAAVHGEQDGR